MSCSCAPACTGTLDNLPAATNPHTNSITGPQQLFRLSQEQKKQLMKTSTINLFRLPALLFMLSRASGEEVVGFGGGPVPQRKGRNVSFRGIPTYD